MNAAPPKAFERKLAEAASGNASDKPPMIRTQMNRRDWLILSALAVIWGSAFLFINVAVREVPPMTYVWARLTMAAAAMWLFLRVTGQRAGVPRSAWSSMLLLAALNNALPFVLIGWGELHIASGLAAILNATTPIWGVLVAHFLTHDERLSSRKLAGVMLGFGGVVVMMGPSLLTSLGTGALAQLAVVLACLSYALAAVWARRFKAQGISPLGVTAGQLTAGAILMVPFALIVDRPWTQPLPSLQALGAIAGLALVCSAFAYVLYFRLIATSGATNATLVTLLAPPVAMLLGAVVLGERLGNEDFVGLGLIAIGLAAIDGRLLRLVSRRRPLRSA